MYIIPDSNLWILKNVPLDTTYDHTILFPTTSDQYDYFASKSKYRFINQTYQRVNRNKMRVEQKADNLYDCNYIMFQNHAYGDKWFYAFIKSVEYVNDITTEIEYEIDVIQTWHFDYHLDYCFVERQHTSSDEIGENLAPEPLECGEYVTNGWEQITEFCSDEMIIVAIIDTTDPDPEPDPEPEEVESSEELEEVESSGESEGEGSGESEGDVVRTPEWTNGRVYDGVFGGLSLYGFKYDEIQVLNAFIATFIQRPDEIQMIYTAPDLFPESSRDPDLERFERYRLQEHIVNDGKEITLTALTGNETIDGYTPKNKKLYTYPYNFYHVDNASGGGLDLRYEFFYQRTPHFVAYGTITQPVKVIMRPLYYKNSGGYMDFSESISLDNYPQCSWNVDAYWAWVAQNTNLEGGKLAKGLVSTGAYKNNIGAGISNIFATAINALTDNYQASIASDILKGATNCGNVNVASAYQDFFGCRLSVCSNYAKRIDDFFTRFGYAINEIMLPNRNARTHYTYLKTIGCTITGSVPCDDMKKICDIYNNGITWWLDPDEIGDYTVTNSCSEPVNQGGE